MFWETCSESQLLKLYDDYHITEKSLRIDVEYLLEWMKQEPHLPNAEDPELLATMIIASKNCIKTTKRMIETYYLLKAFLPQAFVDRNISKTDVKEILNFCAAVPLPQLTPEGFRVWILHLYKIDDVTTLPSVDTIMKFLSILFDLIVKYDRHRGYIGIVNCENVCGAYIALALSFLKTPLPRFGKRIPNVLEKIYVVNVSPMVLPFVSLIKKIIKKTTFKKVEFWKKNPEDLAEVLPKYVLPPYYGGSGKTIEELRDELRDYVIQSKDLLTDDHKKADLTKLPKNCKLNNGFSELGYGIPGSFRNISIE